MEGDREGSAAMSTGSPASSLLPPAEAQPGVDQGAAQQAGDQQPPAAQHAAQQQWGAEGALVRHEVVRVTASNLDMSRPLRSADLLAVYHASVVPRPGQVRAVGEGSGREERRETQALIFAGLLRGLLPAGCCACGG